MPEVQIGVGKTKSGNIGWVMTPEFEAQLWDFLREVLLSLDDPEVEDQIKAARRAAGLRN